ncbi:MAG: ribosome maturation factor RimP [Acidimicrobiia bacterium]|nr:ribosome maturation factor RimP [Acidimicrobiia bacterium]
MDRLWEAIESFLADEQVELDDLELFGRTVRVTVDTEGGIDLDHITNISRGVSRLLDENEELVPESYNLEVTSPGLERKLRRPRHFEKSVGRAVKVKTTGGRALQGPLLEVDGDGFVVKDQVGEERVSFAEVAKARTVFEYPAAAKPGKRGR